jgi:hypothetical protein
MLMILLSDDKEPKRTPKNSAYVLATGLVDLSAARARGNSRDTKMALGNMLLEIARAAKEEGLLGKYTLDDLANFAYEEGDNKSEF